jgi:hypothetical protein
MPSSGEPEPRAVAELVTGDQRRRSRARSGSGPFDLRSTRLIRSRVPLCLVPLDPDLRAQDETYCFSPFLLLKSPRLFLESTRGLP